MMRFRLYLLYILLPFFSFSQNDKTKSTISTTDINLFWAAVDRLNNAKSKTDSIQIIQTHYIDKATPAFKKMIKTYNFTAQEYVVLLGFFPKFWQSLRPLTMAIANQKQDIEKVFDAFKIHFLDFKKPDVCFAIGCIRSGGTTSKRLLLISAEIAAADERIDTTELLPYYKKALGRNNILAYVAHETVHTMQSGFPVHEIFSLAKHRRLNLMNIAITEGCADFITTTFLGLNINKTIFAYGERHQCSLWEEFKNDYKNAPFDYSKWIYNFQTIKNRPADLGYYIGYKISEAYYNKEKNKAKALKSLLNRGKYKKVLETSRYEGGCSTNKIAVTI